MCAYFGERKAIPFSVMLGLIMWARPDGVVFIIAVVLDYLLVRFYSKEKIISNYSLTMDLKRIALVLSE